MRQISQVSRYLVTGSVLLTFVLTLAGGATVSAQTPQQPSKAGADRPSGGLVVEQAAPADQSPVENASLPVDETRIRRLVEYPAVIKLDDRQLRFYVLVLAKQARIDDFIGNYDLRHGPTKGGAAMTHQEFLNMVTPKELNELFGATSGSSFAMFQAALMNAAGQSLVSKAIQKIRVARTEREVQSIREQIDRELAALMGKS